MPGMLSGLAAETHPVQAYEEEMARTVTNRRPFAY